MLYGIGLILLLFSCAVESETLIAPIVVALVGVALMVIGGKRDGKKEV
jgi:hypothetical protein